ncbi:(2E,6E)-farnesyl diphosphate synthase [Candidatus Hamiltonella defensa]|uniref:(2E,6E)-farnesyl diphosphate synthase n=1 Tax=Candidatus Williamhamiltonella defendens TaxID=138072 RepID=UPI00158207AC|nr:(2E,6E)-farnesyl diphosphate synthase [Candidatus Hamiltonella defensa]
MPDKISFSDQHTSFDFDQQLSKYQKRVETYLSSALDKLPAYNTVLLDVMRYSTLMGGKRLRPYLVYATGQMLGLSLSNLDAPAAAIECIHSYSLLHDDLPSMDNDDLRRGELTGHVKFGEANAILAGDSLQSLAFSILADDRMPDVVTEDRLAMLSELARASGATGMCGGQALDMASEYLDISLETLELIHHHKTGALLRAAVRLGALAAGETGRKALPWLDQYAKSIGLAFQVQDDILDEIGESRKTGKKPKSDQQRGKATYPGLLSLKGAQKKMAALYQSSLSALTVPEASVYNTLPLQACAHFILERHY